MFNNILQAHKIIVSLYLLFFLIKVIMLLASTKEKAMAFRKRTMWMEMTLSVLFLITGLYLAFNSGEIHVGNWFWGKIILIIAVVPVGIIAFRKLNKLLAILAFVMLLYIYGISETKSLKFHKSPFNIEAPSDNSINPTAKVTYGKQVYQTACVVCHGEDGKRGVGGAFDLSAINLNGDQVIEVITNGRKAMPAFKSTLTQDQIAAVSIYVLTLKK